MHVTSSGGNFCIFPHTSIYAPPSWEAMNREIVYSTSSFQDMKHAFRDYSYHIHLHCCRLYCSKLHQIRPLGCKEENKPHVMEHTHSSHKRARLTLHGWWPPVHTFWSCSACSSWIPLWRLSFAFFPRSSFSEAFRFFNFTGTLAASGN